MTKPTMHTHRFQTLLDTYGAAPHRWPRAERGPAQDWMTAHPAKAQTLMAQAKALDAVLDTANPANHAPSDDPASALDSLKAQIMTAAQATDQSLPAAPQPLLTPQFRKPRFTIASWQAMAATLFLTTGMGFGIGQMASAHTNITMGQALLGYSLQTNYDMADLADYDWPQPPNSQPGANDQKDKMGDTP